MTAPARVPVMTTITVVLEQTATTTVQWEIDLDDVREWADVHQEDELPEETIREYLRASRHHHDDLNDMLALNAHQDPDYGSAELVEVRL